MAARTAPSLRLRRPACRPAHVAAFGADEVAGPGREGGELDAVFPVGLLHAGELQVLQDGLGEVVALAVAAAPLLGDAVEGVAVLVDLQRAVRGDALDGEGAGDAHLAPVLVGLVVQVLVVGLGGDGGVDLLLAGDAPLPVVSEQCVSGRRPVLRPLPGNLPLLQDPVLITGRRQPAAERRQPLLVLLPDDIDLGVVGDGLEGDVRHALVDEALPDVAVGWRLRRGPALHLRLLRLPLAAVGEEIVRVAGAHDPGAGQRQGHAGGVDGNPAAAPLLGDVGGGAGAAGGVEDEVAWVGCHENTTLDNLGCRLNNV